MSEHDTEAEALPPEENRPFFRDGDPEMTGAFPGDGPARVSKMISEAEVVSDGGRHLDLPAGHEKYGYRAGEWRAPGFMDPVTRLPVECPVIPLGVDNDTYWFLDTIGQVRSISAGKFSRNVVSSLFMMRNGWLQHHWPKKRDGKMVSGVAADAVVDDLMAACGAKGTWNDIEAVRGRGCWCDRDGRLMVHCGDRLITADGDLELGEHDGFVYPSRPAMPSPKRFLGQRGMGEYLYTIFRSWNWNRPDVDPVLAIGFIGAAFLSGALEWRPSIFITGDKATGKSTLQKIFKGVLGSWLVQSADTTPAGIYQRVKHDALPVSVDELESERDISKQKNILKLARLSSSGALMLRGGSDHKGTEFQARSCFAFSSINHPPLEPQDLSRMGMLTLSRLKKGQTPPELDQATMGEVGRGILHRLIEHWQYFESTLHEYRAILSDAGHDGRGQDTFGTLLACADLIIGEDAAKLNLPMAVNDRSPWADLMKADNMAEYEGADENWRLCLGVILSTPIDAWKGGSQSTVGEMIDLFWRENSPTHTQSGETDYAKMRKSLAAAGLSIKKPTKNSLRWRLFIPHNNPALQRLFLNTKWYGEPGAGVWTGALSQADDEWINRRDSDRISGWKHKGVSIPLAKLCADLPKFIGYEGVDDDTPEDDLNDSPGDDPDDYLPVR